MFTVMVEFIGLTFFSFFMGNITELFSSSDNFEDLIVKKLDHLDLWIKKIEKSNKKLGKIFFHLSPYPSDLSPKRVEMWVPFNSDLTTVLSADYRASIFPLKLRRLNL